MFSWYPRRIKRAAATPTGLATFRAATRVVMIESMVMIVLLQRNNEQSCFKYDCRISLQRRRGGNKMLSTNGRVVVARHGCTLSYKVQFRNFVLEKS
jgi:hypothetical protein